MEHVEQIANEDNTACADGDKQPQQSGLHRLAEHDHRGQAQRGDRHHEGQDRTELRALGEQGLRHRADVALGGGVEGGAVFPEELAAARGAQGFERTLDDSANKRISIAEGFLAIDGILDLCMNVVDGLVVYPKVIEKRLRSELPFMATENIMMDAVKAGGDRQELHERIRELSMEAGRRVKEEGADNQLMALIAQDEMFHLDEAALEASLEPSKYVGCSAHQVERFLNDVIRPLLKENEADLGMKAEINV